MSKEEEYEKIIQDVNTSIEENLKKLRKIIVNDKFSEYTPLISIVIEGLYSVNNMIDTVMPKENKNED